MWIVWTRKIMWGTILLFWGCTILNKSKNMCVKVCFSCHCYMKKCCSMVILKNYKTFAIITWYLTAIQSFCSSKCDDHPSIPLNILKEDSELHIVHWISVSLCDWCWKQYKTISVHHTCIKFFVCLWIKKHNRL